MIETVVCTLQVCKEFIDNSQEELEVVQNSFDSDSEGDAELVVQQNSSDLPCSRWGEAAGMREAWRKFTEDLVTSLLICGFCGRGAFGGTPTCEKRFQSIPAVNQQAPPMLAANPFLLQYVGSFTR